MLKKIRTWALAAGGALALAGITPSAGSAAKATCVDSYLLCINDASQESGFFWRTAREVECGVGYYGCMRQTASGS